MSERAVVIGGGIEGVQAALDLANCGVEVTLIEQATSLGVHPGEDSLFLWPRMLEAGNHPNIDIFTGVDVAGIESQNGSFTIKLLQHPRYVKPEACTSCGRCEDVCPVNVISLQSGDLQKAICRPDFGIKSVPSTCVVTKTGIAPCNAACPAGINVQGYVALISKGKLQEALALVREAVPFPHILGRVCTHPCESACTRGKVDQPIGIASLKRYIADMEPAQYSLLPGEQMPTTSFGKVAIIGAGPAGLTCARDLFRLGHIPTVFEALPVAGGMVAVGMPRFRLPREVRQAEIDAITHLGVEIKTSMPIGKDLTLSDLKKQGYEAFFVATGAHKNPTLDIPGEDLEGVIDSIAFLRAINLKQPVNIGNKVVVIGGGYTAIDSGRTAIRLHCRKVSILYRRTAEEMSATPAELLETTEEGVDVRFLVAPVRIIGENGKVTGIECQRMELGDPDESGRKSPVPIEGSEFIIECDTVIPAIGQLPDLDVFAYDRQLKLASDGKTLTIDSLTLATNLEGIFAGGDVVHGPQSMVEAVADGRRAAVSIDRFLKGEDMTAGRTLQGPVPVEVNVDEVKVPPGKRRRIPTLPIRKRVKNFEEVETGYTTFMALREAKRCLSCGGCSECMECVRACELDAIDHGMRPQQSEIDAGVVLFDPQGVSNKLSIPSEKGIYFIDSDAFGGNVSLRLAKASAVSGQVMTDIGRGNAFIGKPETGTTFTSELLASDLIGVGDDPRVGVFICQCGGNISHVIDTAKLTRYFFKRSGISYACEVRYACSDEGAFEIREFARQHKLTHVVLAACACCSLDQICFSCSDRRLECKEKLLGQSQSDRLFYDFINIREHCAWVHSRKPEQALEKAKALIWGGVARARENRLLPTRVLDVKKSALVIGAGIGGVQAAVDLAEQGFKTTVIPFGGQALAIEKLKNAGVRILNDVSLEDVQGAAGDYRSIFEQNGKMRALDAGAIIVDLGVLGPEQLPDFLKKAVNICRFSLDLAVSPTPGIFLCGRGSAINNEEVALIQGSAAAVRASALLRKNEVRLIQTVAVIDPKVCRGCGTCSEICGFGAASLVEKANGILVAEIDDTICRGCGTCAAHCPSCAITQTGLTDCQITAAMEAMLATD